MFIIFKVKGLKLSSLFDYFFNDVFDFLINELKSFILILIIDAFKFEILFLMFLAFANIVFLSVIRAD